MPAADQDIVAELTDLLPPVEDDIIGNARFCDEQSGSMSDLWVRRPKGGQNLRVATTLRLQIQLTTLRQVQANFGEYFPDEGAAPVEMAVRPL